MIHTSRFSAPSLAHPVLNQQNLDIAHSSVGQNWMTRHVVTLEKVIQENPNYPIAQFISQVSRLGREKLVAQVRRYLQINCELSGLAAYRLLSGVEQVMNLDKVRRLSMSVETVYERILAVYSASGQTLDPTTSTLESAVLDLQTIETLAKSLQPVFQELRQIHLSDDDPRTIGFLTTQFHFTNQAISQRLKPWERSLLLPYLQFAEECVCIPWIDISEAMTRYSPLSAEVQLAEHWISKLDQITQSTYEVGCHELPEMRSTRGDLRNPQVAASVLRDTTMFQGYLLLCLLEGNMDAIQKHLLPLCVMVFPAVGVSWIWIDSMLRMMISQIEAVLSPQQWSLVAPYAAQLLEIFEIEDLYLDAPEQFHTQLQSNGAGVANPSIATLNRMESWSFTEQPESATQTHSTPETTQMPHSPQSAPSPLKDTQEKVLPQAYVTFNAQEASTSDQPFVPQLWAAFSQKFKRQRESI